MKESSTLSHPDASTPLLSRQALRSPKIAGRTNLAEEPWDLYTMTAAQPADCSRFTIRRWEVKKAVCKKIYALVGHRPTAIKETKWQLLQEPHVSFYFFPIGETQLFFWTYIHRCKYTQWFMGKVYDMDYVPKYKYYLPDWYSFSNSGILR